MAAQLDQHARHTDALQTYRFLRGPQVDEVFGCKKSKRYEREANGLIPPRLKQGRSSAWLEHEVNAVAAAIAAGATEDEIRVLVRELVAARPALATHFRQIALGIPPAAVTSSGGSE